MKPRATLALALALGLSLMPGAGGAVERGLAASNLPATQAHGVNFQVESQLNTSFCIQIESGTNEGRSLTMLQCGSQDTQRWGFSWYASGVNQMLDSQGMCLTTRGHKVGDGLALAVQLCRGDRTEWLTYTSLGLLEFATGCLQIASAANNIPVSLATCDATKQSQLWLVTH